MTLEHSDTGVEAFIEEDIAGFLESTKRRPTSRALRENWFRIVCVVLPGVCYQLKFLAVDCVAGLSPLEMMACFFAGGYLADLFTGVGHMVLDGVEIDMSLPASKRPMIQFLAFGFQYHHLSPTNWHEQDLLSFGILRTGFYMWFPFTLIFLLMEHSPLHQQQHHHQRVNFLRFEMILVIFSMFTLFAQFAHAAAHGIFPRGTPLGRATRAAQRLGFFVSSEAHHLHHTLFDVNFCIVTGWANPFVNYLYVHFYRDRFISSEMTPEVQRQVFVAEKSKMRYPYYRMFPEYRRRERRRRLEQRSGEQQQQHREDQ